MFLLEKERLSTGHRTDAHPGAGKLQQCFGAGDQRGSRGDHIVDQQDMSSGNGLRVIDFKDFVDVPETVKAVLPGLSLCGLVLSQGMRIEFNTHRGCDSLGKKITLVVSSFPQLGRVKRNGDNDLRRRIRRRIQQIVSKQFSREHSNIFSALVLELVYELLHLFSFAEIIITGGSFNLHFSPKMPGHRILRVKMKTGARQMKAALGAQTGFTSIQCFVAGGTQMRKYEPEQIFQYGQNRVHGEI